MLFLRSDLLQEYEMAEKMMMLTLLLLHLDMTTIAPLD